MTAPTPPPTDRKTQRLVVGGLIAVGVLVVGQYIRQVYRDLSRTTPVERFEPAPEKPAPEPALVAIPVLPAPKAEPVAVEEEDKTLAAPTRLWTPAERADALSAYVALVGQLTDLARAGRLPEGRPFIEKWLAGHAEHAYRAEMARQLDWLALGARWSAPLEKNSRLANLPLVFSEGATVIVQRVEGGRIFHGTRRPEGMLITDTAIGAVPAYQIRQLLVAASPSGAATRVSTWLMNQGLVGEALSTIQRAVLGGEQVGPVEEWARDWSKVQRNRQAYTLLDRVEASLAAGRGPEAQRLMELLQRDFVDCDVVMWAATNTLAALAERLSALPVDAPAPVQVADAKPVVAPLEVDKDFGLGELMRPSVRARIQAANSNAVSQTRWSDHLAYLDRGLLSALRLAAAPPREHRYDAVLRQDFMATLLAQSAFIRRVGTEALDTLSGEETLPPFLGWLVNNRAALEDFLLSTAPSTDAAVTLRLWSQLWTDAAASREKYHSLALACALVFDQPVAMIDDSAYGSQPVEMNERYTYFVNASEKKGLKTEIDKMPAWELVWVVDAAVPNKELDWARTKVTYAQRDWGRAYGSIRYRMDKISKGKTIYKEYTLDQIKCEGGTCGDQAHYAATTAKANGIPAMVIAGDGDLGGHAWMGYKASAKEWNLTAGRLGDSYANGGTTDPQTRQGIGEKAIQMLADPQRRSEGWLTSYQMMWLSAVFQGRGDTDQALLALNTALDVTPRNADAFDALVALLESSGASPAAWQESIQAAKLAFRNYPDQIRKVNELELSLTERTGGVEAAAELAHRQRRRMNYRYEDRQDLLLQNIDREAGLLTDAGDLKSVESLYRKALFDYGEHMVMFRELTNRYVDFARKQGGLHDALWFLSNRMNQHQGEPKWNNYFEVNVYAGLLETVAALYDEDLQGSKAERLRKKADRMRTYAKQFTK